MKKHSALLFAMLFPGIMLVSSCFKSDNCVREVFENENLFLEANLDGRDVSISDATENRVFMGLQYQLDSTRVDTMIFYFHCHYFIEENESVSLTLVRYANVGDVLGYGNVYYNYPHFGDLMQTGTYQYHDRIDSIADHAVRVTYIINDSIQYDVDTASANPEDFYFEVDQFIPKSEVDCYNRSFEWYNFTGTFGCRLVNREREDTVRIENGTFRSIAMQYR